MSGQFMLADHGRQFGPVKHVCSAGRHRGGVQQIRECVSSQEGGDWVV